MVKKPLSRNDLGMTAFISNNAVNLTFYIAI